MQAQRPDRREEPEPGWQDTDDDDEFFVDAWDDEDGAEQEDGDETTLLLAGQPTDPDMQQQQPARLLIEPLQHAPGPLQHQQQQQPADQIDTQALQQAILQQVADPQAIQWLLQTIHPGDGSGDEGDGAGGDGGASSTSGSRSDSDSSDGSMSDEEASSLDGAQGARAGCVMFDPNVAARHQYLGDVDELEGSYGHLPEGTTARLPLLVLDGVVLFPGCQLPLLLNTPHELHLLDRALAAPAPFTRLLAVLPGPRSLLRSLPSAVCCTAEVRQMRRQGDDERSVAVLALGRQRAEVVADTHTCAHSQVSVNVRILSEGCTSDVPLLMRQGFSSIHPALTRPWDLQLLVGSVRRQLELVLLPAASFQGSPLELSYWVSHNLPLPPSTRQLLLMCSCPADRLRLLLELLQRLDQLCCSACGTQLATTAEVLAMTTEGIGGTYVNSHGYVHEMVTFNKVHGLRLYGRPETEHSWFPGYAWTIAHCGTCGQHMGWRFTATQPALMPRTFWGLRRPGLLCATAAINEQGDAGADGEAQQQQQLQHLPHGVNWMDLLMHRVRRARVVLQLRQEQRPGRADAAAENE